MGRSFLESTFLTACPALAPDWDALRRARAPGDEPSAAEFLGVVALHLRGLVAGGQVAEFSRVSRTVERLLEEADPILLDLLRDELLAPIAHAAGRGELATASLLPHLGPRTRSLWKSAGGM
jgi:hypothetical protein